MSILIFCAAVEVLGQFESACGGLEDLFNYFRIVYKARINAIEPKDGNFEILTMNTKKYENIVNIKAAIRGSAEKRAIQNRHTGHWGYTVSKMQNNSAPLGQMIDCITVDSLMKEYELDRISILKMDIESGEKDVLENSSAWIESVDIMTVELHDRICMGCDRAFYLARKDFAKFEKHGEKVTACRN